MTHETTKTGPAAAKEMASDRALSAFAERVVAWQRLHGRHGLPWQGTRDAYRIWLSEIMLQQTQVATVLRYYEDFLQRFPTVAALASAAPDEVLAAWSGLGYYSRARNLHACAQAVVAVHGGVFPTRSDVLQTLPGIGRSTAAAIAAFSAGERAAILDGNVKRVLARHRGVAEDLSRPVHLRHLWTVAESLLPDRGIEAYTQGLMDLGATLCLPRQPQCLLCPVQADCVARREGQPQAYPVKAPRTVRGAKRSAVLMALIDAAPGPCEVMLTRRPDRGIWAGLWTLPLWDDDAELERVVSQAAPGSRLERLSPVVHALTHLDWTLVPYRMRLTAAEGLAVARWLMPGSGEPDAAFKAPALQRWALDAALALGLPAPIRRWLEAERNLR